jgi:hypothetical protein
MDQEALARLRAYPVETATNYELDIELQHRLKLVAQDDSSDRFNRGGEKFQFIHGSRPVSGYSCINENPIEVLHRVSGAKESAIPRFRLWSLLVGDLKMDTKD